jgi:phospholipid/cholesterol/gamma-HCH transport system ATP-binding protein
MTSPIQIESLSKTFGAQTVLQGLDLTVAQGEVVALMGRSGTGKSVLLRLIVGLQNPDSGSIRVLGQEVNSLSPDGLNEVRKKIGFLFQGAALYDSLTVQQNVAFPMERHRQMAAGERQERVRDLLEAVGMADHAKKLPSEISGGMQKRVGLARALALDPDLLLFDEPTSGLDPITSAEIDGLIVRLNERHRVTSLVVTHDVQSAKRFSDRVALIDKGSIVAEGTMQELDKSRDPFVAQFLAGESEGVLRLDGAGESEGVLRA